MCPLDKSDVNYNEVLKPNWIFYWVLTDKFRDLFTSYQFSGILLSSFACSEMLMRCSEDRCVNISCSLVSSSHSTPHHLNQSSDSDGYISTPEGSYVAETKHTCDCRCSEEKCHTNPPDRSLWQGLIVEADLLHRLCIISWPALHFGAAASSCLS